MRVTDLGKQQSVVRNLQANEQRMQKLQENISSGKRITTLSDDPVGATQAQDFRTSISFMKTLQRNIQDNFVWLERAEAETSQMGDLLRRAKTLVLAQANASGDEATRRVTAQELEAIIDAIAQSGNSKIGKLYIFSGSETFTEPLRSNQPVSPAVVNFQTAVGKLLTREFDPELVHFEGFSSNNYLVRITKAGPVGRAHYQVSDDGGENWSREKTLLTQNEIFNETGNPNDKVVLRLNLPAIPAEELDAQVEASLDVVEGVQAEVEVTGEETVPLVLPEGLEFEFRPNPALEYRGNLDRRMVQTGEGILLPLNITAHDLLFASEENPETVNVFDVLFAIKAALMENDPASLEARLDDLDLAFDQVLRQRAGIGAVRKEMDDRLEKLRTREFSKVEQLSDVEDLDVPEAMVELNLADARHKVALDAGGRLLQPSLINFLR